MDFLHRDFGIIRIKTFTIVLPQNRGDRTPVMEGDTRLPWRQSRIDKFRVPENQQELHGQSYHSSDIEDPVYTQPDEAAEEEP